MMASRYVIHAVQFDEDGVVSIVYLDREDALRDSGNMFRTQTLSITPESVLAPDLADVQASLVELLAEATQVYRDTPAFVPEDEEDEEDDEKGMGF